MNAASGGPLAISPRWPRTETQRTTGRPAASARLIGARWLDVVICMLDESEPADRLRYSTPGRADVDRPPRGRPNSAGSQRTYNAPAPDTTPRTVVRQERLVSSPLEALGAIPHAGRPMAATARQDTSATGRPFRLMSAIMPFQKGESGKK